MFLIMIRCFIIDGNTIEDGLKYLIENKYNDFMKDIKVEYFKKDSYYIEDEIFLKLVERFK